MCDPVSATLALVGGGLMGFGASSANKAQKAQESANKKAEAAAKLTAQKSEEATNRANAKSPDTMALRSANERQAKGGISGTLLTGAAGVQPGALMLGRTTLLGS